MNDLHRGTLKVTKQGKIQVLIGAKPFSLAAGELSKGLIPQNGLKVEFALDGDQPRQVRAVGQQFVPPQKVEQRQPQNQGGRDHSKKSPSGAPQSQARSSQPAARQPPPQGDFHNPYNFIPAPPRETEHPDLGDGVPPPQDTFHTDMYTGRIRVCMTVSTPLLVPDTVDIKEDGNGHKTFKLRTDDSGLPSIPTSSIRGLLRSAFEAVTNSRFGRLSKEHKNRLAFRMDPRDALRLVPARIANGRIHLLTGTSGIGDAGKPDGPMYAAWLPRYRTGQEQPQGNAATIRYADGALPQHGDEVVCWIERMRHNAPNFTYWRVREVIRGTGVNLLGNRPNPSQAHGKSSPYSPADMRRVRGWVCVTNANIKGKHDERVFFIDSDATAASLRLTAEHRSFWRELIGNYQATHEDDLAKRDKDEVDYSKYLGHDPGKTAWSRHVYTAEDKELRDGTLCYFRLSNERNSVDALFPVMISRELYAKSPWDLLCETLHPAPTIEELSPADRVFGWVRPDGSGPRGRASKDQRAAVRGLLRVGPVVCLSNANDAVQSFAAPGVPLAILAAPKPQQGRFYVAASSSGDAQRNGLSKLKAGYSQGKGIRGRKVYPHHSTLPDGHWINPTEDRTQQAAAARTIRQEYRRPMKDKNEQRDGQNRSILGWVKPGAQFTFDLHVRNLSKVELGALLWLLSLPREHFFRLGGGKPLGFGSVRLTIDDCDVPTGAQLRERYINWRSDTAPADPREQAIEAFKRAVVEAYATEKGQLFKQVPFIRAFLVACQGFLDDQGHQTNLPIHYPRATANGRPGPPSPDGEAFKWFAENERQSAPYSLPDLAEDRGLPTLQRE